MTTATKTTYRATYTDHRADIDVDTRWYDTPEAAQDALMKRREVGSFQYLGNVSGDVFESGRCLYAPRNGGAVSIDARD
jgi:hypothetical protein